MNIKHIWSVLCRASVIDQDDKNISIHGVLEELSVNVVIPKETEKIPQKVGIPIGYEIVSLWQKSDKINSVKATIEYSFIDPKGEELLKNAQEIEINTKRFRSRMKISGMPVTSEGEYTFKVRVKTGKELKFQKVSEIPLEIKLKIDKHK